MGCAPSKIQDGAVAEGQPDAKANGQPDGATPAVANEQDTAMNLDKPMLPSISQSNKEKEKPVKESKASVQASDRALAATLPGAIQSNDSNTASATAAAGENGNADAAGTAENPRKKAIFFELQLDQNAKSTKSLALPKLGMSNQDIAAKIGNAGEKLQMRAKSARAKSAAARSDPEAVRRRMEENAAAAERNRQRELEGTKAKQAAREERAREVVSRKQRAAQSGESNASGEYSLSGSASGKGSKLKSSSTDQISIGGERTSPSMDDAADKQLQNEKGSVSNSETLLGPST